MNRNFDFFELGQSYSKVELVELDVGKSCVRKYSLDRIDRLHSQYLKHIEAKDLLQGIIAVPNVLSEFSAGGYLMEYVAGVPLGTYLKQASKGETEIVAKRVEEYFAKVMVTTAIKNLTFQIGKKIDSISFELAKKQNYDTIFEELADIVKARSSTLEFPVGWNHGDLSFENILVSSSVQTVNLIDFLNSPFESPMIDLGRLWLDARFGWWGWGMSPSANSELNGEIIANMISRVAKSNGISRESLNLFAGLAVLRVAPYTRNPVRLAFLKKASMSLKENFS